MKENNFKEVKGNKQVKPNFCYKDVTIILCVVVAMFITVELFQVGFYIVDNILQAFCIFLVNVPFFAFILYWVFNKFVILSIKRAKKRG